MEVPVILGKPINVWLGILLIILLTFQILTGKRLINLPFTYHRRNAMLLVLVAAVHAFYGLGIWFLGFSTGP